MLGQRKTATRHKQPDSVERLPVATSRGRYFVEALGRGLEILDCFIDGPAQLNLGELSTRVGLNKVTTFRLLRTLIEAGYVRQEPRSKDYKLTLKMLDLQEASLTALQYPYLAQPYLEELNAVLNESISMAVLEGTRVRYVARAPAKSIIGVILHVGSVLPAHATSMGKVLLAALTPKEIRAKYANQALQAFTPRTITTQARLLKELVGVERNGYATSCDELETGLVSAAAPVRGSSGQVIAAINASASTARVSRERLIAEFVPAVVRTAASISTRLGYRDRAPVASLPLRTARK